MAEIQGWGSWVKFAAEVDAMLVDESEHAYRDRRHCEGVSLNLSMLTSGTPLTREKQRKLGTAWQTCQ